jgi:hypothetical protein
MKSKQQKYTEAAEREVKKSVAKTVRLLGYFDTSLDALSGYDADARLLLQASKKSKMYIQNVIYDNMLHAVIHCRAEDREKYAESYITLLLAEKIPKWVYSAVIDYNLFSYGLKLADINTYLKVWGTEVEEGCWQTPDLVRTKVNLYAMISSGDAPFSGENDTQKSIEVEKKHHKPFRC